MKLLARIRILYDNVCDIRDTHNVCDNVCDNVCEWTWHVLIRPLYFENNALSLAIFHNKYDIMLYLLKQGADPRCGWAPDEFVAYRSLLLRLISHGSNYVHIAIDTILSHYNCIDDLKPFHLLSSMISSSTTLATLQVLVSHGLRFYPYTITSMFRLWHYDDARIKYAYTMKCENFDMQDGYAHLLKFVKS